MERREDRRGLKLFVLHLPVFGTFLGVIMGQLVWSNSDAYACLPIVAIGFQNRAAAIKAFGELDTPYPIMARLVEVPSYRGTRYVHVADCIKAGLPGWNFCCDNELPV